MKAVFLDRDGVLIEDAGLVSHTDALNILPGVPEALSILRRRGFELIVVTNQPIVARGIAIENDIRLIHEELSRQIMQNGGPAIDAWYFCPHHPNATLAEYRINCDCRKPRSGMIVSAAKDHEIDLGASWMVGDRITDIIAGHDAGCRTIQVLTGKHIEAPITTVDPIDETIRPDYVCDSLLEAVRLIVATDEDFSRKSKDY